MNIIIDTHVFLWLLYSPEKIKSSQLEVLQDLDNSLYLSSMSIAEIMIKKSLGKLDVEFQLDFVLPKLGVSLIDYDAFSALRLASMPFHHQDPFDRMIISQAIENKFYILTADRKFKMYDCLLIP